MRSIVCGEDGVLDSPRAVTDGPHGRAVAAARPPLRDPLGDAHRGTRRHNTQDGRQPRRSCRRWKIEWLLAWLKNFRRLVTRSDRHVENFLAFGQLAGIVILSRRSVRELLGYGKTHDLGSLMYDSGLLTASLRAPTIRRGSRGFRAPRPSVGLTDAFHAAAGGSAGDQGGWTNEEAAFQSLVVLGMGLYSLSTAPTAAAASVCNVVTCKTVSENYEYCMNFCGTPYWSCSEDPYQPYGPMLLHCIQDDN